MHGYLVAVFRFFVAGLSFFFPAVFYFFKEGFIFIVGFIVVLAGFGGFRLVFSIMGFWKTMSMVRGVQNV